MDKLAICFFGYYKTNMSGVINFPHLITLPGLKLDLSHEFVLEKRAVFLELESEMFWWDDWGKREGLKTGLC